MLNLSKSSALPHISLLDDLIFLGANLEPAVNCQPSSREKRFQHRAFARLVQSTTETVGSFGVRGPASIDDFRAQKFKIVGQRWMILG